MAAMKTLKVDTQLLVSLAQNMQDAGVRYRFGAKMPLTSWRGSREVDCSGFVRYALWRASGEDIGDGSVQQHDRIKSAGFKPSTPADARRKDGILRIAFLAPHGKDPGHVVLILNGKTLESYGGHGPGRRVWLALPLTWQSRCEVFCLTLP